MRKIGVLLFCVIAAGVLSGCGDKDKALDKAAPPVGPDATANPPTKAPGEHGTKPPVFPGPKR